MSITREAWLDSAVEKLRPIFSSYGFTIPELRVSVGWPSKGALAIKKRVIGQCWYGVTAADGKPQLFISPLLDDVTDAGGVLATLVHEVCHVAAGAEAKHGPKFVKVMKALGLTGKPTATTAGAELISKLVAIAAELGPFPHSKLIPTTVPKTQTTRQRKCECPECGYLIRITRKWAEVGLPICPVPGHPVLAMEETEGEEEGPDNE